MNENFDLCQVLLVSGADPNVLPGNTSVVGPDLIRTTLAMAVRSRNRQIVELLLEHDAEVHDRRGVLMALEVAIQIEDTAIIQLLLLWQADLTLGKPLVCAVEKQNLELIAVLLPVTKNLKVFSKGLYEAVKCENSNLVRLLLEAGADPNFECQQRTLSPLVEAARLGNFEIVDILLAAGADCNQWENSVFDSALNALQAAAAVGNWKMALYLLDA